MGSLHFEIIWQRFNGAWFLLLLHHFLHIAVAERCSVALMTGAV